MGRRGQQGARARAVSAATCPVGRVYVQSTFNNTIITFTDPKGNVLVWHSAGQSFKGSRKSTPYAAQMRRPRSPAAAAMDMGMR